MSATAPACPAKFDQNFACVAKMVFDRRNPAARVVFLPSEFSLASEFSVPNHDPKVVEVATFVTDGREPESVSRRCAAMSRGCVSVSRIQPHVVMCRVRMT